MSAYEKMSEKELDQLANYIVSIVQNGASIKDESEIPDGFMEGIYSFAYDFYQKGKLDEAEAILSFYVSMIFIMLITLWDLLQLIN